MQHSLTFCSLRLRHSLKGISVIIRKEPWTHPVKGHAEEATAVVFEVTASLSESSCRLANVSAAAGFIRGTISMKNGTQTGRLEDILTINLKAHSSQSNCNCVMLGYSDVPTANGFGITSETRVTPITAT